MTGAFYILAKVFAACISFFNFEVHLLASLCRHKDTARLQPAFIRHLHQVSHHLYSALNCKNAMLWQNMTPVK